MREPDKITNATGWKKRGAIMKGVWEYDPRLQHIAMVFVSEQSHEKDRRRAFEFGAVDYIAKPFDTVDFAPRLLPAAPDANNFVVRTGALPNSVRTARNIHEERGIWPRESLTRYCG